ncbi:hypothetical protein, partial [Aurantimonas coralicida]|uniref:hypothetical protein n=1 Tax=Aurantimonas coralicida TaxID=182270 RepID=UPI001AED0DF6
FLHARIGGRQGLNEMTVIDGRIVATCYGFEFALKKNTLTTFLRRLVASRWHVAGIARWPVGPRA